MKSAIEVLFATILFARQPKTKPEVKITIDSNTVFNTMQGGFGASIHAIEDSLPVSTDGGKYRSWGGSVWELTLRLKIDRTRNRKSYLNFPGRKLH
jgi:hypothetical protein